MSKPALATALRDILREFSRRASGLAEPPVIYVVGAGSLVLENLTRRATQDLDFVCDRNATLFVNVIEPTGNHSHSVPPGLVSMPRGWRDRARPLRGFRSRFVRVLVPELADRLMDKLARGSATDWQDIEAVARSAACPAASVLCDRARSVLLDPPSSVFDPDAFVVNYERLRGLLGGMGRELPALRGEAEP